MKSVLMFALLTALWTGAADAMNAAADMVRSCEGIFVTDANSYILKCPKTNEIVNARADGVVQFFPANNGGDVRGTFLDKIPNNIDFVYVNVVRNLPDPRYKDQTCYRFVREKNVRMDGIYATEICEYERPDYYL